MTASLRVFSFLPPHRVGVKMGGRSLGLRVMQPRYGGGSGFRGERWPLSSAVGMTR
jgi:hypothetical protein